MERNSQALSCQQLDAESMPLVSVIAPCRNEVRHIEAFVRSLQMQEYPADRIEFLVADGLSDDGTRELLSRLSCEEPRLFVCESPGRTVPIGLNVLIRRSRADIIVRMDVHTTYAPDYVARCVQVLASSGADCVGGPWRGVGQTYWQRAIAAGFRSRFGSGGALSHDVDYEGEVDSVYLGCWRRELLLNVGLFDEELVRNQDDELCLRIKKRGGKVWQAPSIRSEYHPRGSLWALFRQYFQYGYWKVRVIQKHGQAAALRHLVPAGAVIAGSTLSMLAPFLPSAAVSLAALVFLYSFALVVASFRTCERTGHWSLLPAMPTVFVAYHVGYGLGFCRGMVDFKLLGRAPAASAARLTR